MLILFHVAIAIGSLLSSTASIISPTTWKLHTTYGLISATMLSGTWLVVESHAALVSSCISGLLYLATAVSMTVIARKRLLN